jgi:hypothetical protein
MPICLVVILSGHRYGLWSWSVKLFMNKSDTERINELASLIVQLADALQKAMREYNQGVGQGGGSLQLSEIQGRLTEIQESASAMIAGR